MWCGRQREAKSCIAVQKNHTTRCIVNTSQSETQGQFRKARRSQKSSTISQQHQSKKPKTCWPEQYIPGTGDSTVKVQWVFREKEQSIKWITRFYSLCRDTLIPAKVKIDIACACKSVTATTPGTSRVVPPVLWKVTVIFTPVNLLLKPSTPWNFSKLSYLQNSRVWF